MINKLKRLSWYLKLSLRDRDHDKATNDKKQINAKHAKLKNIRQDRFKPTIFSLNNKKVKKHNGKYSNASQGLNIRYLILIHNSFYTDITLQSLPESPLCRSSDRRAPPAAGWHTTRSARAYPIRPTHRFPPGW
jgi:hypothetical protein